MSNLLIKPIKQGNIPVVDVSGQQARVQESRLFAALLESGWGLKCNKFQAASLVGIAKFFPIQVSSYSGEKVHHIDIFIDHSKPVTRFGDVERPLIFPTWIANVGMGHNHVRKFELTFQGFPTKARVLSMLEYIEVHYIKLSPFLKRLIYIVNDLPESTVRTNILNLIFSLPSIKGVKIVWSIGGRKQTYKVVDEKYWRMLHSSLAVFCPKGDFGWTYRFYEAMLAGALPVLDYDFDEPFVKPFTVVSDNHNIDHNLLKNTVDKNKLIVKSLVTAFEDLDPINFITGNGGQYG